MDIECSNPDPISPQHIFYRNLNQSHTSFCSLLGLDSLIFIFEIRYMKL